MLVTVKLTHALEKIRLVDSCRYGNIKEAEAAGAKAKILGWGGKIAQE